MKKTNLIISLLCLNFALLTSCGNNSISNSKKKSEAKTDSTEIQKDGKQNPYSNYSDVIKQQSEIEKLFTWPLKHELDLNDDSKNEEFQAVEGYSRGMNYVLFFKEKNEWKLICGDETIPSGHIGIKKLDKKNNGWHDFVAYQPSGREGIIETYYTWNGTNYVLKEQKEVQN